ncbi:hypothetical protein QBC35DRAFT_6758 [Podospora australis]|uniref:Uncharacterized protein n=1 Tax=Podospora australis TaxID=1536484 RepID=A0AAN6X4N5_9PEZI|nr:hypothetical protein QBC35DRAFT_6758 [Podospora australis]
MSWFSKLVEAAPVLDEYESSSVQDACKELSQNIPESFTLDELTLGLEQVTHVNKSTKQIQKALLATLACLCLSHNLNSNDIPSSAKALARLVSKIISPIILPQDGSTSISAAFDDTLLSNRTQLLNHCRATSHLGLEILSTLPSTNRDLFTNEDDILLTLIAYADPSSSSFSSLQTSDALAQTLKSHFNHGSQKDEFITKTLLGSYLRPLFSASKPSSITASGRKKEYPDSDILDRAQGSMPDDTPATKPWKYTDLRAIPVFCWAVSEADENLITQHWPLYVPVLLTLTDDGTTPIRHRGLLLLADFLSKFPTKILQSTGLGQVFQDAILPTLSFLPSLTPEDESLQLLVPAYEALLILAKKQSTPAAKNALLDRIIREGIFMGYFHAKEHVRIVEVFCRQTVEILTLMGIHGVKHLKDIIPILSTIVIDPFAAAAPATLVAAIKALQAVLTNCWPRIPASNRQDEIINALVLCWLNLSEHEGIPDASREEIQKELITSAQALAAVVKTAGIDLASRVAPLLTKTASLQGLFPTSC